MRGARYATLDGLRGIAAVAVALLHTSILTLGSAFPRGGGSAVDFFFLLSGFILAYVYPKPGLDFLKARWIRLYPMILFGVSLGAGLMLSTGPLTLDTGAKVGWLKPLLYNLAGFPAPALQYPYDGPLWSISLEVVASILYFLSARGLSAPALAAIAVALAFVAPSGGPQFGLMVLPRALFPFTVGVLLYKLPAPQLGARWAVVATAVFPFLLLTRFLLDYPVLQVVVFAAVLTMGRAELPGKARDVALYLGRLSYPIYVIHAPIAGWASTHGIVGLQGAAVCLVATIAISHLAAVYYDEPARRFLSRVTAARVRVTVGTVGV